MFSGFLNNVVYRSVQNWLLKLFSIFLAFLGGVRVRDVHSLVYPNWSSIRPNLLSPTTYVIRGG